MFANWDLATQAFGESNEKRAISDDLVLFFYCVFAGDRMADCARDAARADGDGSQRESADCKDAGKDAHRSLLHGGAQS